MSMYNLLSTPAQVSERPRPILCGETAFLRYRTSHPFNLDPFFNFPCQLLVMLPAHAQLLELYFSLGLP